MKPAVLVSSIDGEWEGLYIDDRLIDEGHKLGDGNYREFWLSIAHNFGIRSEDIAHIELNSSDNKELSEVGNLPAKFTELGPYDY